MTKISYKGGELGKHFIAPHPKLSVVLDHPKQYTMSLMSVVVPV
jgi:hypothetical protein